MLRGFISGVIWGGILAALVGAVVSLLLPLPQRMVADGAAAVTQAAEDEGAQESVGTVAADQAGAAAEGAAEDAAEGNVKGAGAGDPGRGPQEGRSGEQSDSAADGTPPVAAGFGSEAELEAIRPGDAVDPETGRGPGGPGAASPAAEGPGDDESSRAVPEAGPMPGAIDETAETAASAAEGLAGEGAQEIAEAAVAPDAGLPPAALQNAPQTGMAPEIRPAPVADGASGGAAAVVVPPAPARAGQLPETDVTPAPPPPADDGIAAIRAPDGGRISDGAGDALSEIAPSDRPDPAVSKGSVVPAAVPAADMPADTPPEAAVTAPARPPSPEGTQQETAQEKAAAREPAGVVPRAAAPEGPEDDAGPATTAAGGKPRRIQVGGSNLITKAAVPADSRLPQVRRGNGTAGTDADTSPAPDAVPGDQAAPQTAEGGGGVPAMRANAVPFDNSGEHPLMAVVLIDDPARPLDDAVLAGLSFPVTFAIDAGRKDAQQVARRYREAGFEVVILTDLPKGAAPQDLEVAFQAYKAEIPVAVALMGRSGDGFQASLGLVKQAVRNLAESGHGLLVHDRGLNTAMQLAGSLGVPAGLVFRMLDDKGENAHTMRRYLDRAAFRAGQEGQVIVLGHTRPETLQTLLLWMLRNDTVQPAPLSAVLGRE